MERSTVQYPNSPVIGMSASMICLPPLAIGDFVAQGQTVGYLSEPTKYYSVEGPNLYFEVTKDGEAKDPAVYME